jgi:hypothetical protein
MALIECPECGREISDKAVSCPNCGAPIKGETDKNINTKTSYRKILVIAVLIIVLILGAVGGLLFFNSKRVDLVAKSVVKVHCYDENGEEIATGSGFIAYDRETFITNYHVLAAGKTMSIETESGASFNVVKLIGYSEDDDLAILGLDGDTGLKPLRFDDSRPKKGDKIYAIGSPQGIKNTVSDGLVSSVYDDENGNLDVIQISAPISQGSSGGVLLNSACEAIGVTSSGYTDYSYQNINFAIPIKKVEELYGTGTTETLESLIKDIHKSDHDCAMYKMDSTNVYDIETLEYYMANINGDNVFVTGYYSSQSTSSYGKDNHQLLFMYDDIHEVTGSLSKDMSDLTGYLDEGNQLGYGGITQININNPIIHDDCNLKKGDRIVIYGNVHYHSSDWGVNENYYDIDAIEIMKVD